MISNSVVAFIAVFILLANEVTAVGTLQNIPRCSSIRGRREIRTLSDEERNRFFAAVRALQSGPRPTVYDRFVQTHYNARQVAHGWPWFLPWHRAFIREFERRLQEKDSSVMLPYWDWAYDSQAPEQAPVWQSNWLGGNGRSSDNCVTDGVFARWRPYYPDQHCLKRSWTGRDIIPAFYSSEALSAIASRNTRYTDFCSQTESPAHDAVHVAVGADMATMYSPNDPIFWLHHAFVDKQWSDWQRLRPRNSQAYGGINQDGSPARPSDQLQPYPYRVLDVLDTRDLCYTYAPFRVGSHFNPDDIESNPMPASTPMLAVSNRTAIDPLDRTEILGLRIPTPIPDSWLVMNHANVTAVRETEMFLRNVALEINNLRSHVSPSVPASQPDILAGLIKKIKPGNGQLTATRRGRQIVLNSTLLENLTTDEVVGKVQQFLDSLRELPVVIQDNIEEATLESIIGSESAEQLRDNYDI